MFLTLPAYLGIVLHVGIFRAYARSQAFGGLSLPCLTALTSLMYFYIMPALMLAGGEDNIFGMYLKSLNETHWISILYVLGAFAAFLICRTALRADPRADQSTDPAFNWLAYALFWLIFLSGISALVLVGQLNVFQSERYDFATESNGIAFLGLSISVSISLTLMYLIIDNFKVKSLCLLFTVLYIYAISGFRFRMLILSCAATICFATMRGIRLRPVLVLGGATAGLAAMNLIGTVRKYGAGFDLNALEGLEWSSLFSKFNGEMAMVFVTQYAAENPPQPIYFDPWVIAAARFVPTFLWPDKPYPEYLRLIIAAFPDAEAQQAGVAAPQQVEMIFQFGWFGLPVLACLYFTAIVLLGLRISQLTGPPRLAGMAIIPAFFGYYMQSRGYFFQMISETIFTFLPVFVVGKCSGRFGSRITSVRGRSRRPATGFLSRGR